MRRQESIESDASGHDSFLDVTTNIVGILIILVVVVGLRAKNATTTQSETDEGLHRQLASLGNQVAAIQYDIVRLTQETDQVRQEAAARLDHCARLATAVSATAEAVSQRRAQLDAAQQQQFDLEQRLHDARAAVERAEKAFRLASSQKGPVVEMKHYPTPISRTVFGRELHFELRGGRVSFVPLDSFIEDVRSKMRSAGSLADITEKVGVAGPRGGFEFRYTTDIVTDRARGVVGIRTREWQIAPVGISHGETAEKALAPQSQFRFAIAPHSPRDTTITLWTYPDSFKLYRQLKEELHRLGYAAAGRPLPDGVLIGGSNRGTKSSAQ